MDWFLHDNGLRHERVKFQRTIFIGCSICTFKKNERKKRKKMNFRYTFSVNYSVNPIPVVHFY